MCSHPGSLRPLASGQQAYKPSLSLTPTFPQREHLSTADQSRVPRQAQAQTSTPRSFPDIIHSSQSRTIQSRNADYDASDTPLRRQADCLTIHNLPNPIESAYSPHRQSASISPQELSNGSSRATTSGWEADVDPSKMFDYALTHRESENLSTGVTSATSPKGSWVSRPSEAKGKAINQRDGRFGEESAGEVKKRRVEDSMREVERDLGSLQTYLNELSQIISPFATSSAQPSTPVPPSHLYERFTQLSTLIHSTLVALGPHVHPFLDPAFDIPLPGTRSVAEKDMEIIRKRRDALIARAKGPAERNLEAGEGQVPVMMETTACESEKVPSLERCHGCGVSVTDAWRRGPDGPRSLCDICGLHYAKLAKIRHRDDELVAG